MESNLITYDKAFLQKLEALKADMYDKYLELSREKTKPFDATGRPIIRKRPDGFEYLEEAYMRIKLDKHFPGWSWQDGHVTLLGSEWILCNGHLLILDEYLLPFGVIPPYRRLFSTGAARIQFKTCGCKKTTKDGTPKPSCPSCSGTGSLPHTAENVVDIDKNIGAANSNAFKRSINRLCHIGDDVYGKRIDDEGAGTMEEIMANAGESSAISRNMFYDYVKKHNILTSKILKLLEVSSFTEIHNWVEALNKIKGMQ